MSWNAVEIDFSKLLQGKVQTKRVTIPKGLTIVVPVECPPEFQQAVLKNPSILQKVHEKANQKAQEAAADAVAAIKEAEVKAQKLDQKAADALSKELSAAVDKRMQIAGREISELIVKLMEYFKHSQAALKDVRIKAGFRITANTVSIVGAVVVTGVSHGALTPFTGIAIGRSSVAIAQDIARLATDCSKKAKVIEAELVVLKKTVGTKEKELKDKDKFRKNSSETVLGILSGLAGVETPSVKNCKKHIEEHRIDVAKLDKSSKEYSQNIYKLMDKAKEWENQILQAAPALKLKLESKLKKCEADLDKVIKSTIKVNEAVAEAWKNDGRFKQTIEKLTAGVQEWTKYVDIAVGATVDIAMAIGNPDDAVEAVLGALTAISVDVLQAAA
jgi:hypothetical protein